MKRVLFLSLLITYFLVSFGQNRSNFNAFIENSGQVFDQNGNNRPDVKFSGKLNNQVFHLFNNGISYQLSAQHDRNDQSKFKRSPEFENTSTQISIHRTDLRWINAKPPSEVVLGNRINGKNNYYNVSETDGIIGVNSYDAVKFKNIYEGIDVQWYFRNGQLEYDFLVESGADYRNIQWEIHGSDNIFIDSSDALHIQTPFGEIVEQAPIVFQKDSKVFSKWKLENNLVSFILDGVDSTLPLRIDPIVRLWSTYYGGTNTDQGLGLSVDTLLHTYVCGTTESLTQIATSGSHLNTIAGNSDAYVVKFDLNGSRQWCTYYGGTLNDDGYACAIDDKFNVYLTGRTSSSTGISTAGSHQTVFSGVVDAYLIKFNENGVRLWGTYLGGSDGDLANSCAVDKSGNIYICGSAESPNNISTVGSHQPIFAGSTDAFLTKFSPQGAILWSTYYSGSDDEIGYSCTVDRKNNVYMAGWAFSNANIGTPGTFQHNYSGFGDAFIVKFDSSGSRKWGSYYGGPSEDFGWSCSVDDDLNVYISGETRSSFFIATPGSHQTGYGGNTDAFIGKLDSNGQRVWGTYFGGSANDNALACEIGKHNYIYLAGSTRSTDSVSYGDVYQSTPGGDFDAFLAKLETDSGFVERSTYFGGNLNDVTNDCKVDAQANVYITGNTLSLAGVSSTGSHQSIPGGAMDGFLVKFRPCAQTDTTFEVNACFSYTSPSGRFTVDSSGTLKDTLINNAGCDSVLTIDVLIDTVNVAISVQNRITITAAASPATYRWLDCDNDFNAILGATGRSFSPARNGNYAVIVTENSCSDTSECVSITDVVGIQQLSSSTIKLYPNPTSSLINLSWSADNQPSKIQLFNQLGILSMEVMSLNENYTRIDLSDLTPGIYFLRILANEEEHIVKVIKTPQ